VCWAKDTDWAKGVYTKESPAIIASPALARSWMCTALLLPGAGAGEGCLVDVAALLSRGSAHCNVHTNTCETAILVHWYTRETNRVRMVQGVQAAAASLGRANRVSSNRISSWGG
jgi:hypothetical protein